MLTILCTCNLFIFLGVKIFKFISLDEQFNSLPNLSTTSNVFNRKILLCYFSEFQSSLQTSTTNGFQCRQKPFFLINYRTNLEECVLHREDGTQSACHPLSSVWLQFVWWYQIYRFTELNIKLPSSCNTFGETMLDTWIIMHWCVLWLSIRSKTISHKYCKFWVEHCKGYGQS